MTKKKPNITVPLEITPVRVDWVDAECRDEWMTAADLVKYAGEVTHCTTVGNLRMIDENYVILSATETDPNKPWSKDAMISTVWKIPRGMIKGVWNLEKKGRSIVKAGYKVKPK